MKWDDKWRSLCIEEGISKRLNHNILHTREIEREGVGEGRNT